MTNWIFKLVGADDKEWVSISQVYNIFQIFSASDTLPEFLRGVRRYGTEAHLLDSFEVREGFVKPFLLKYCVLMTRIGIGKKDDTSLGYR